MNIAELQNEVINRMRRPDLVDLIKSRVIGTIKQLHGSGYYARDRVEEVIKIGNPSCTTKLTIPPYWRRFVALVPFTESGTTNIPLRRTDHQDFELSDVISIYNELKLNKINRIKEIIKFLNEAKLKAKQGEPD